MLRLQASGAQCLLPFGAPGVLPPFVWQFLFCIEHDRATWPASGPGSADSDGCAICFAGGAFGPLRATRISFKTPSVSTALQRGGAMTDEQLKHIVEHLCEHLHLAIRLKGSEAHPPNAKELGFDSASARTVLLTGLRAAGVTIHHEISGATEEPPWS